MVCPACSKCNRCAHIIVPALGITEEVEKLGLKGSKKKKGKKLDEDFIVSLASAVHHMLLNSIPQPDLKPIFFKDIPKVVQAMRQTQSRKVLVKLLTRIKVRSAATYSNAQLTVIAADRRHASSAPNHAITRVQCHDKHPRGQPRGRGDLHSC